MYYLIYGVNEKGLDALLAFEAKTKSELRNKIVRQRNKDYANDDDKPNMYDYLLMLEDGGHKVAYKETEASVPKLYDVTEIIKY